MGRKGKNTGRGHNSLVKRESVGFLKAGAEEKKRKNADGLPSGERKRRQKGREGPPMGRKSRGGGGE